MDLNKIKNRYLPLLILSFTLLLTGCPDPEPVPILDQPVKGFLELTSRIAEEPYEYTIGVIDAEVTISGTSWSGENVNEKLKTDEFGYFELFLDEGTYTITPEKLHWKFTPASREIKITGELLPLKEFTGGAADGYEVDPWGYIWSPMITPAATWEEAKQACEDMGGRLPTVTEIYRNSYGMGLGTIGETDHNDWLWTMVDYYGNGNSKMVCRTSDGATYGYAIGTARVYRCVWPDKKRDTFRGTYIYGPPGNEGIQVKMHGNRFYMDRWNRPFMPYNAVLFEAAFYRAQLPSETMYTALIREGMENDLRGSDDSWLWTADSDGYYSSNGHFYAGVVKWDGIDPNFDDSYSTYSSWHSISNGENYKNRSRFMGAASYPRDEILEISTDKWVDRNSRLKADLSDRTATVMPEAVTTCFQEGGHLPTYQDQIFLIRSGLPNGSGTWFHIADMMHSGYHGLIQWSGTQPNFYFYHSSGTMTWTTGGAVYPFRAVYYPVDSEYNGPNESNPGIRELFKVKIPRDDGAVVKVWADANDRTAATFAEAVSECYNLGGHLATYRDMAELIREGLPNGSDEWLWTSDKDYRSHTATVKWDGVDRDYGIAWNADIYYGTITDSNKLKYRCVWTNEIYAP